MDNYIPHYAIVDNSADLLKSFFVRAIVFCEEQEISYEEEIDGMDYSTIHFLGTIENEPVATARMYLFKDYVKIERKYK